MKKALICGISGQDGSYLARLLLLKGYSVFGTSRDVAMGNFNNLTRLGIKNSVNLISMVPSDFRSTYNVLEAIQPDEIYDLAGQTSVGLSFEQPTETFESIINGTLNLLETIRILKLPTRLYNACSSDCFGNTSGLTADESTPFRPRSPYAIAKATSYWTATHYREAYGLHVSSGILFNHESPLRPERFVTKKIIASACRIASGSSETLRLGNLNVERDWGWAPEYVDAMWRILQQREPEDFVIATGQSSSLEDFVSAAFAEVNLDYKNHIVIDPKLFRPTDVLSIRANPSKSLRQLGWKAEYRMKDVVSMLVQNESQQVSTEEF